MQTFIDMGYVGISSTDISCVRMIEPERAKLALIEDGANNLVISLELPSVISATTITTGSLTIASSDSIGWTYVDNKLSPYLNYPITVAHMHYYDATPTTSDYTTYNVPTYTCILDSLRVYVNGIRVGSANVYVPASTGPTSEWTQTRITSQTTSTFTFNRALDPSDIVRIDFDILTA
jgi:hypothetical protein